MSLPVRRLLGRARRAALAVLHGDCTRWAPPSYTRARADQVYGEGFRRCCEYLAGTAVPGDVVEFGCFCGFTSRWLAHWMRDTRHPGHLYLYDSFQGFPAVDNPEDASSYEVAVNQVWLPGNFNAEVDIPQRIARSLGRLLGPERVTVVPGFFDQTLAAPLASRQVGFAHVDCDLYSSSRCVLDRLLADQVLADGALLAFDDYNCNRAHPQMGQRRALVDAFAAQTRYSYSAWFDYSWSGRVFFVHDSQAASQTSS